jgi:membrane fusion protein, multidrug efflux system
VHSRNVTILATEGETSAVTGVKPGEQLVTDGFDKLQNGTKIVVRKQAQAEAGAAARETAQETG